MDIYYFSATGNSLHAAKILNGILGGNLYNMKKTPRCLPGDVVVFAYPVHAFGLPMFVEEYISGLDISNCRIYALQTSAGSSGAYAAYSLNKLLGKKGLRLCGYITATAPNNYLLFGVPQSIDGIYAELSDMEKQIESFVDEIKAGDTQEKYKHPFFGGFVHFMWKCVKPKDRRFNANEKCTSCGVCQKLCPSEDIILENGKPKWLGRCTACMACVHMCPQKAINIGHMHKEKYQNPYINIDELV